MHTVRHIKTFIILFALLMGATSETWAQLTKENIVVDGGVRVGETDEYAITNGSVTITDINAETRTVTITVTPNTAYYVNKSDIIVQKLVDPAVVGTPRRMPDIADALTVSGPTMSKSAQDYTFVVPTDYAGALVTVTFTAMEHATATVTPNTLVYTGEAQELVTLGAVVGGEVTYSLSSDGTYSSDIPTSTNAGNYTVYYKVSGDATHAEGSGSVSVTIDKAQITSVVLDNNALNYNGSSRTVSVTSVKAGTIDVSPSDYTYSGNTATDIGTYTVTVTAKPESVNFTGSATVSFRIVEATITIINSSTEASGVMNLADHYLIMDNISASVLANLYNTTDDFTGTLEAGTDDDGNFYKINMSGYSHALFNTINGGTVKNVILDEVSISYGTNVGAICNEATGETRIYNCGVLSGSVGGSDKVGGIVGLLDGSSRVINCFNYADITSGSDCGGIVGYNNKASTSGNLLTMVMNCMFYGNITGGNAAPIYGGENIHNKYTDENNTGLNNYCYFLYDEDKNPYVKTIAKDKYHGALGAEERYLNRFEFFRMTLNSTRNLAAYYVLGDATKKEEMAKWVLDKGIAPYPILKVPGYYPSIVNPDAEHATDIDAKNEHRNEGRKLGTLTVTINNIGSGAVFSAPAGAHLIDEDGNTVEERTLTLNVTDKDYANYNFNYKKVQLPYYSEVGTGNYTKASDGTGRVVTGWKITGFTNGTAGTFTGTGSEVTFDGEGNISTTPYNFVDRKCTNKDYYGTNGSNRVFNQGAYWEVPDGVTGITIEPYWAKAVYLSDANYDVTYRETNKYGVTVGGTCPTTHETQTVYTDMGTAITNLAPAEGKTVYDYAVVLVGNYHHYTKNAPANNKKPMTIMSADLDGDYEPDNTLFYYHDSRKNVSPIRFDFLNIPGIGMMKRTYDATNNPEPGIFKPNGWFEITNTVFVRFGQFEYAEAEAGSGYTAKLIEAPVILQGGIYEQFVSTRAKKSALTNYLLVGGNAWFKNFANGCHTNSFSQTPKVPINVTGGDYENFYLTGIYQPNGNPTDEDAECYIDGGRFKEVAGAGMQRVDGNVTWLINAADITNFFGGGINDAQSITGNITTIISNSHVDEFYGGPKFGNMSSEKKVKTTATDCHFGKFFGAGYGGTSLNRVGCEDATIAADKTPSWSTYFNHYTRSYETKHHSNSGSGSDVTVNAISTSYDYEYIIHSDGSQTVARFFVNFASLSLASTRDVISNLTDCTIGDFYGGGSLGAVYGNINSTLTNCTVTGNAFGAGFSASVPTVEVWDTGAYLTPYPNYNRTANVFNNASVKTPKDNGQYVVYTWSDTHGDNENPFTDTVDGKHYIHTDQPLNNLGAVTGNVTLTINGNTVADKDGKVMSVGQSVYGGGEESGVNGNITVSVTGGTIGTTGEGGAEYGNVYGGGKGKEGDATAGLVKGNANVTISGSPVILHNIYGGGAYGSVGDFTYDATSGMPTVLATTNTGACTVTITGGTIGSNGKENGMVFGSSRGDVAIPVGTPAVDPNDRMAWVYSTHVTIGDTEAETSPLVKGSVYGSGENGHTFQNTIIDIKKGTIGIPTGEPIGDYSGAVYPYRGNVYGGGCGTDTYWIDANGNEAIDDGEKHYNPLAGIVRGNASVNITGGHVVHNVYGAGAMGSVGNSTDATSGKTTINISGGRIGHDGNGNGHVFGAARGEFGISTATSGLANVRETEVNISYPVASTPTGDNTEKTAQLIAGSVFGGGEAGTVKGSVAIKMIGGLILNDVYGGGALADTQTSNWDATNNTWAAEKTSASTKTTVRLTGGTILGEAYGGGLGETGKPARVYGDVLLDLNGTTSSGETGTPIDNNARGCAVHEVFGCNNVNGTPKGDVKVHVYATQNMSKSQIANTDGDTPVTDAKTKGSYDVLAVYGGGNLAAYEPAGGKNTTNSTNVIIDGCGLTSIQYVYGGGNAASTPATKVTVNGTFEIEELFGGGNGKDALPNGDPNPGANVGFYAYKDDADNAQTPEDRAANYGYGTGQASVNVYGGTIHRVFGGSNTKGNVRQTAVTLLDENSGCDFCVDEAYGGGKSAPMDAEAKLLMACIPGLNAAYGGAEAAAIQGNVTLNITNGTFDRVFGGNNLSGTINGSITVNIEEVGCKPIIIGELYGGGNQAGYSIYGYNDDETLKESGSNPYQDPQVNVKSFTSIGNIFGGGYGSGATMVGNPTVNINEVYGKFYNNEVSVVGENEETSGHYPIPSHVKGKIGAINNVFGGGNAAKVIGNTNVNIGTLTEVYVVKVVGDGDDLTGQHLYTRSGAGTTDSPYTYTEVTTGTANPDETYYEKKDVLGVDIRGDVYGGGNNAEVTGDTHVTIGKETTTTSTNPTPTP